VEFSYYWANEMMMMKVGTDAALQEREQLYTALVDWLGASAFGVDPPTHGVINEHQLIESAATARDVGVRMLLGVERLRAVVTRVADRL